MPDCACLLYILTNPKWWPRAAACTTLLQFCVWRVWLLCKRRCPHHRHRCVLWVDRQMDRVKHSSMTSLHMQAHGVRNHLTLPGWWAMRSTTSKLVLLVHTPALEGATLEVEARGHRGKGEGGWGKEEARREREQEVVRVGGTKMWPELCVLYNTVC